MTQQIIDINWHYVETSNSWVQRIKLLNLETEEISKLDLTKIDLDFSLTTDRYCTGFFKDGEWVHCVGRTEKFLNDKKILLPVKLTSTDTKCQSCERLEGFKSAFIFGGEPNENIKPYLEMEHYVYLAYFPLNTIKVGTASVLRKNTRLMEQDALIYTLIAKSDGFNIQKLEHSISTNFNLPESVSTRNKYKYVGYKLDSFKCGFELKSLATRLKNYYANSVFSSWFFDNFEIIDNSKNPLIFYPSKCDDFVYTSDTLKGKFLGLRGKIIFVENNEKITGIYKNDIIGRIVC